MAVVSNINIIGRIGFPQMKQDVMIAPCRERVKRLPGRGESENYEYNT